MKQDALDNYVARTLATAPKITDQKREEITRHLQAGARR